MKKNRVYTKLFLVIITTIIPSHPIQLPRMVSSILPTFNSIKKTGAAAANGLSLGYIAMRTFNYLEKAKILNYIPNKKTIIAAITIAGTCVYYKVIDNEWFEYFAGELTELKKDTKVIRKDTKDIKIILKKAYKITEKLDKGQKEIIGAQIIQATETKEIKKQIKKIKTQTSKTGKDVKKINGQIKEIKKEVTKINKQTKETKTDVKIIKKNQKKTIDSIKKIEDVIKKEVVNQNKKTNSQLSDLFNQMNNNNQKTHKKLNTINTNITNGRTENKKNFDKVKEDLKAIRTIVEKKK